ncbi:MAG TPA: CHAT domain-containing protein [Thermoanaerobaculia bacterium]|nr:CHAT domain-containing protein [Thermoanaerobaculia bacterium]
MEWISFRKFAYAAVLVLLAHSASTAPSAPSEVAAYSAASKLCDSGHWLEAESFLQDALSKFRASDSDEAWGMRTLYGLVLRARGKFPEAVKFLSADLPPRLRSSVLAVHWLGYRAIALARNKEDSAAEINLNRAERLARARHPEVLDEVLWWRANLAFTANRPDEAEIFARDGLRFARRYHHNETDLLATLAIIFTSFKRYDEAVQLNTKVLALATAMGNERLIEKSEGNLAWLYSVLGDYENVKFYADAALQLAEAIGAERDRVPWLIQVGDVARFHHEYPTAITYYRRGVDLAKQQKHSDAGDYVASLAVAQLESGDLTSARRNIEDAAALDREKKDEDQQLRAAIVDARIDAAEGNFETAIMKARQVLSTAKNPMQKWEAEARIAQFAGMAGRPAEAETHFRNAIEKADQARRQIKGEEFRLPFGALVRDTYDGYIALLLAKGRVQEALSVAELGRAQNLEDALDARTKIHRVDPKSMARQRHAIVLSYWLAPKQSYVWAITGTSIEVFILPPMKTIEQAVDLYSTELQSLRSSEQLRADGTSLYRLLVQPVAHRVPRGARVIVIPDGRLHALNMETLIDGAAHYWIENVTIETAASLELLDRPKTVVTSASMLLVGDPPSPDPEFPSLTNAAKELELVQHHFPSTCKILQGGKATPGAYETASPGSYSYIHFVAHGIATRQRPLDSAVVLARHGDSYKLYARDILKHPLRARLVTISSCHGAGTRAYTGEGLVGLAWAFLHAGASQVIAALWEVNDNATPKMMDDLYTGIRAGHDPATALRDAKLKLIRGGTVYRQPRYWAPFVLYSGS